MRKWHAIISHTQMSLHSTGLEGNSVLEMKHLSYVKDMALHR